MITDTNVSLSRWPFRRLAGDDPAGLVGRLRQRGVTRAWAGSFDALLHRDIAGVNARLAADCRTFGKGLLVPFGAVNPRLPDWREDLRRCHEEHRMPGIRLHPDYHGYGLNDAVFAELLTLAAERNLVVQLALRMEDDRTQHPLVRVSPVNAGPLPDLVRARPGLRLVVLNWKDRLPSALIRRLAAAGQVWFEISALEGVGALSRLIESLPAGRVLFGSNFPLFYFESSALKVREAGLAKHQEEDLLHGNAARLLSLRNPTSAR